MATCTPWSASFSVMPRPMPREPPVSEAAVNRELSMRERSDGDPPPASPLFSGVFNFPWYDTSNGPWLAVACGLLATGIGLRGLVQFFPR